LQILSGHYIKKAAVGDATLNHRLGSANLWTGSNALQRNTYRPAGTIARTCPDFGAFKKAKFDGLAFP
jgi:hypothetical protein